MMVIMQNSSNNKASAQSRKEATHERIVEVATRAIRRSGYAGTKFGRAVDDALIQLAVQFAQVRLGQLGRAGTSTFFPPSICCHAAQGAAWRAST